MKNNFKKSIILLTALSLAVLGTAQINSDYDKTVDFTKYKTFSFAGWQDDSDKLINDLDKARIYKSFKEEFALRGINYQETNADMVVSLYLVIDNKTSTTAYTNYMGGMGYGYRARWGYGMGYATTTYSENDYQVGTLVIDCYDSSSKKLMWQASSQGTIQTKASKREKTIPKKIKKLMKKYPIQIPK